MGRPRDDARGAGKAEESRGTEVIEVAGELSEPLRSEFGELGLSPYESRVMMALLRLGSANTLQIAQVTGVPRTSTYQVLESLASRRLAARTPGGRVAVWAAARRDEVFERLEAAMEAAHVERVRQFRTHIARARRLLDESVPEPPSVAMPYVHTLMGPVEVKHAYDELLTHVRSDLLMFTRPPYAGMLGRPKPEILDMLGRGVSARVLYQADRWEEPDAHAFRQEMSVYHEAGVQARLTDHLPIKLVLVDHRVALVGMSDPVAPEAGYPVFLLIEHPGFVAIQVTAFEGLWESSRPLTPISAPTGRPGLSDFTEITELTDLTDLTELATRPDQT